eukprot:1365053-Amphidinium_carterae.2
MVLNKPLDGATWVIPLQLRAWCLRDLFMLLVLLSVEVVACSLFATWIGSVCGVGACWFVRTSGVGALLLAPYLLMCPFIGHAIGAAGAFQVAVLCMSVACPCSLPCACNPLCRAVHFSLVGGGQPFVCHDEDCYHAMPVPEVGKSASLRLLTLNVTSIRKHVEEVLDLDADVCVLSETRSDAACISELDSRLAAKSWRAVWGVPVGSQDRASDSHVAAHRGAIVLAKSPAVAASFPVPECLQPWYFESRLTCAQVSRMGVDGSLLVIAVYASVSDAKDRARMFAAIVEFLSGFQGDWVLAGDFQTVVCDDAALLQMVADARACEPADFFMAPQDRCCHACSIIGLDSFPTHCAVVIEVLLGPSCACDVIASPVPLPALKADVSKLRSSTSPFLLADRVGRCPCSW